MSEKRRQRKGSSSKNANANNLYAYRVLPKEPSVREQPKILQKPREERPIPAAPVQISIASRPVVDRDTASNEIKSATFTHKSVLSATATTAPSTTKETRDTVAHDAVKTPQTMLKPTTLISDFYQINNQAFDHIIESNAAFFVVGVIGAQSVGKSTILNLIASATPSKPQCWSDAIVNPVAPVFKTRQSAQACFSNMPVTEGVDMFITADRTIMLDCAPVICNPYKKELILNELDDLKIVMFLLNVCHTLIVVDEGTALNMPLIRLIQCAEKMKLDYDRENGTEAYSPNVIFVKNKCDNRDFLSSRQHEVNAIFKHLFKDSKLRIATDIYFDGAITNVKSLTQRKVNTVYLPTIGGKKGETSIYSHCVYQLIS